MLIADFFEDMASVARRLAAVAENALYGRRAGIWVDDLAEGIGPGADTSGAWLALSEIVAVYPIEEESLGCEVLLKNGDGILFANVSASRMTLLLGLRS